MMGKFHLADSHHFSFTFSFPFHCYMKQLNMYGGELVHMGYILQIILSDHSPFPSPFLLYTHTIYVHTHVHRKRCIKWSSPKANDYFFRWFGVFFFAHLLSTFKTVIEMQEKNQINFGYWKQLVQINFIFKTFAYIKLYKADPKCIHS